MVLGRFADDGPTNKTADAEQNEVLLLNKVTYDSSELLRHIKMMQWSDVKGRLWKIVEEHYKYQLRIGQLAVIATQVPA